MSIWTWDIINLYRIYNSARIVILLVHINLPKWRKAGKLNHKYITLHCFDVAFTSHDVSIWPIRNYHAYKVINNICSMYISINICVCRRLQMSVNALYLKCCDLSKLNMTTIISSDQVLESGSAIFNHPRVAIHHCHEINHLRLNHGTEKSGWFYISSVLYQVTFSVL